MIVSIEQHVDWIADCIGYTRARFDAMEASKDPRTTGRARQRSRLTTPSAGNSWYMAPHPGQAADFMPYIGGVGVYRQICNDVAAKAMRALR